MKPQEGLIAFPAKPEGQVAGELVIEDTDGSEEVKLPAGELVLYPSTSLKPIIPVTRDAGLRLFSGCRA